MTIEEIKQFLRENLTIDSVTTRGSYGMGDHVKVSISLDGEKITETYIDIPESK